MKLVVLESPYAGDIMFNEAYARRCLKDSLCRNEAPFLGHLLYTQVLDDSIHSERKWGISSHIAWIDACDAVVIYEDYGRSSGMLEAEKYALNIGKPIEYRKIETFEDEDFD